MTSNKKYWLIWTLLTLLGSGWLVFNLQAEDKSTFLPGQTSHGHYQIEMACTACHGEAFAGEEGMQQACMNCHGEELKIADDSHPKSKFTDPRNADRVAKLNAKLCVTCHVEHKAEITNAMGVTVANDVCYLCHKDIAEDRPSHVGMAFDTCASAGCHNFHDNRGLYEDFLAKHLDEAKLLANPKVIELDTAKAYTKKSDYPLTQYPFKALGLNDIDAPEEKTSLNFNQDWLATSHAKAGVNCSACHNIKQGWQDKPSYESCKTCHQSQVKGFTSGKHGMRLKQGLSPMQPEMAKQAMKQDAHNKELGCNSCHRAHEYKTDYAAIEACLGCHNDEHSLAYKKSAHYRTWLESANGITKPNSSVSCASCHMPRERHKQYDKQFVRVQHNQNDNLRPNEKMLRGVCMHCHGLGFAIDALADQQLIENNFSGQPSVHIESLDLTRRRLKEKK